MFAPITFNFTDKKALVVGASKTGLKRAEKLSEYGCEVTILSEEFPDESKLELFKTIQKRFNYNDLYGYDIVIAATNNTPLNVSILKIAQEMGLLANSVNYDNEEDFQFPASFQFDDLFISVSTSGKVPFLAKRIKDKLEEEFKANFSSYFRLLAEARDLLKLDNEMTSEKRKREFERLQELSIPELRKYNDSIISKDKKIVRIGTRRSNLALKQTNEVMDILKEEYPDIIFLVKPISTTGDKKIKRTIQDLGGKASFIKEFNTALVNEEIDFAIHSAKDIDLNQLEETEILEVFPKRQDTKDVLLTKVPIDKIEDIEEEMTIGTGSIRRKTFIEQQNKNLKVKNIRGNVETRISKLLDGYYDGIILAKAGLNRLGIDSEKLANLKLHLTELDLTPAPLQGVLAYQTAKGNKEIRGLLKVTEDKKSTKEANLELKIQEIFNIDCTVPFGALVETSENTFVVKISTYRNGKRVNFEESYSDSDEFLNELEMLKMKLGENLE